MTMNLIGFGEVALWTLEMGNFPRYLLEIRIMVQHTEWERWNRRNERNEPSTISDIGANELCVSQVAETNWNYVQAHCFNEALEANFCASYFRLWGNSENSVQNLRFNDVKFDVEIVLSLRLPL